MRVLALQIVSLMTVGCAYSDEDMGSRVQQLSITQSTDVSVPCVAHEVRSAPLEMQHTWANTGGNSLFYVAGTVSVQYEVPAGETYGGDFVETYLSCMPGIPPISPPSARPYPDSSTFQSVTGNNHWKKEGAGSYLTATHVTKAIYDATAMGDHTCWLIYKCGMHSGGTAHFLAGSTLTYYNANSYPGVNWTIPCGENSRIHDPAIVVTPGGSQIWSAGTATQYDDEVVVSWLPRITNCEDVSGPEYDPQCVDPEVAFGTNQDTYFDWRIVVYQYNGNSVCNKDFGVWNNDVLCRHYDHHCDHVSYTRVVPIVQTTGSEAACGGSMANRKFKVYAQIRKSNGSSAFDDGSSDLYVHGCTSRTNLTIYSRQTP